MSDSRSYVTYGKHPPIPSSLRKVGEATFEELVAAPGMTESAATAVREYFAAQERL